MADKPNFQDIILRFLDFWKEQGCLIWHPHNVQVGAGTMNPATVLRVLGPEPWNVAYMEPSIRPDDGRFGDNPNRMQMHHQMQVILKPDPGNPQELYLQSLEAVGINTRQHDIRFVEDNWEQPALGAWGLGWEVWLDGQEITQFTYFQQAGSVNLDPVSVEITYGLDRIALALQGVDSVWDIDYGAGTNYGDLLLEAEVEHCRYYFNQADVETLKNIYDGYENEAKRALAAGLVAPAHDFNLKCSWLFNVLDTRGAIGVTERANYFARMRSIARQVAEAYVEQRQRLEYPFLDNERWQIGLSQAGAEAAGEIGYDRARTFVLEIGSEELPAGDLTSALRQLKAAVPEFLEQLRLSYERLYVWGTPRRLAVVAHNMVGRQDDLELEVKGPPADRAFDAEGRPTKAALGFARSKGIKPEDLKIVTEGERRYAAAVVREAGRPASEVLAEALPDLIAGIKFEKSMRWNSSNVSYSRPLRWLVALFGEHVVPFSYAGVNSGRVSRGLRLHGSPAIEIETAGRYASLMAENNIVIQTKERKAVIMTAAANLAEERGGAIRKDPALLAEVANLVEQPTLLRGRFEERFLKLPPEVLVAVMKKHQRYFPVYAPDGRSLLPFFITVRNGDNKYLDIVRQGNEHVIKARFSDAEFFYENDRQKALADFLPKLGTLTFQADLGSMLDKVRRLEKLTPEMAAMLQLSEEETAFATRAAALSKADLGSSMVVEMTSLQGIMGGHYARLNKEPEAVAEAIAEQYEAVSETRPGLALALADRLDSLAGLFAAGLAPKGSNDPYALRRAAIQIIENLIANQVPFDLRQALKSAAPLLPVPAGEETIEEVLTFVNGRLENYLVEKGIRTSVVRAVLAEQGHDPYSADRAAAELDAEVRDSEWPALLDAYARCARISRDQPAAQVRPAALQLPEEKQLLAAVERSEASLDGTIPAFVLALRKAEPAITSFFDSVLVMDDDPAVRQNRLALVQRVVALADGLADLSYLEGF
ncbi:MAG: glycine--tRNA ligase subunit beta [Chloroflexota bacterium]|jgi:glycyl-tRNA synthetase